MISECLYGGKSLAEVAGYDPWQWRLVLCRARNSSGQLIRDDGGEKLPPWVEVDERGQRVISKPVSFSQAFMQVQKRRGKNKEQSAAAWAEWMKDNPGYGQRKSRRKGRRG